MPKFYKYQGTGNDFVVFDNMERELPLPTASLVAKLCDRKFGVGADGLIMLSPSKDKDFEMVFFNPDGSQSLCGNGCRCAVAFANKLGIIESSTKFMAIDGEHSAEIEGVIVKLLMNNVEQYEVIGEDLLIDTGSPHYIRFVSNVDDLDLVAEAKKIRFNNRFKEPGVNVNFVQTVEDGIKIRTYERGVEGETLSCGTGVTAAALATFINGGKQSNINVHARGGELKVEFLPVETGKFSSIYLIGSAEVVFNGEINEWI